MFQLPPFGFGRCEQFIRNWVALAPADDTTTLDLRARDLQIFLLASRLLGSFYGTTPAGLATVVPRLEQAYRHRFPRRKTGMSPMK